MSGLFHWSYDAADDGGDGWPCPCHWGDREKAPSGKACLSIGQAGRNKDRMTNMRNRIPTIALAVLSVACTLAGNWDIGPRARFLHAPGAIVPSHLAALPAMLAALWLLRRRRKACPPLLPLAAALSLASFCAGLGVDFLWGAIAGSKRDGPLDDAIGLALWRPGMLFSLLVHLTSSEFLGRLKSGLAALRTEPAKRLALRTLAALASGLASIAILHFIIGDRFRQLHGWDTSVYYLILSICLCASLWIILARRRMSASHGRRLLLRGALWGLVSGHVALMLAIALRPPMLLPSGLLYLLDVHLGIPVAFVFTRTWIAGLIAIAFVLALETLIRKLSGTKAGEPLERQGPME